MISRHRLDRLAVFFLALAGLLSGYYSFFVGPENVLIDEDEAAKWEERMQPLREELPVGVQEMGYLADPEFTAQVQEYSLTRYTLAPIVVRHGVDFEWIVGNFTEPGFESILNREIPDGYDIERFGSGIYLIHRSLP